MIRSYRHAPNRTNFLLPPILLSSGWRAHVTRGLGDLKFMALGYVMVMGVAARMCRAIRLQSEKCDTGGTRGKLNFVFALDRSGVSRKSGIRSNTLFKSKLVHICLPQWMGGHWGGRSRLGLDAY